MRFYFFIVLNFVFNVLFFLFCSEFHFIPYYDHNKFITYLKTPMRTPAFGYDSEIVTPSPSITFDQLWRNRISSDSRFVLPPYGITFSSEEINILLSKNTEGWSKFFGYQYFWHRYKVNSISYSEFVDKFGSDSNFRKDEVSNLVNMINSTIYFHNDNIDKALPDINKAIFCNDRYTVFRNGVKFSNSFHP